MLDEIGAPPRTLAEVHSFVGKGMAVLVERCLTYEQAPTAEQLHQAIEAFKRHYVADNGKFTRIYPGVIEGLQAWKASGIKMGVVTNKPGMFTEALLDRMGMTDYFDVIVSGDTTAHKKPHPEPILHACRLFNVRPDRNLHIGDSSNDIHAVAVDTDIPHSFANPDKLSNCPIRPAHSLIKRINLLKSPIFFIRRTSRST